MINKVMKTVRNGALIYAGMVLAAQGYFFLSPKMHSHQIWFDSVQSKKIVGKVANALKTYGRPIDSKKWTATAGDITYEVGENYLEITISEYEDGKDLVLRDEGINGSVDDFVLREPKEITLNGKELHGYIIRHVGDLEEKVKYQRVYVKCLDFAKRASEKRKALENTI